MVKFQQCLVVKCFCQIHGIHYQGKHAAVVNDTLFYWDLVIEKVFSCGDFRRKQMDFQNSAVNKLEQQDNGKVMKAAVSTHEAS